MTEELQAYFRDQTDKKLDQLQANIDEIQKSMEDLRSFKVEMMVSSRWVSLVISSLCGLATMIISAYVSWKVRQ